jgi:hypothetical protein
VGVSDDKLQAACPDANTITGCSDSNGTIALNADRNPAAISATLVHERNHAANLNDPTKRSEVCARWRAVRYVRGMSGDDYRQATSGNIPVYTTTEGSDRGCF